MQMRIPNPNSFERGIRKGYAEYAEKYQFKIKTQGEVDRTFFGFVQTKNFAFFLRMSFRVFRVTFASSAFKGFLEFGIAAFGVSAI